MDEPVNPIKELRESLNLTHAELCKNLNIAPSTLVRTEQGLYAAIPPIIKGWYDEHSLLGSTPISDYRRFQNGVRGRNLPRLVTFQESERKRGEALEYHPFINWRFCNGYFSRLEFCKDFCLHPSTIIRFEKGVNRTPPKEVLDLLRLGDLDWELLSRAYTEWRNNVRGTRSTAA